MTFRFIRNALFIAILTFTVVPSAFANTSTSIAVVDIDAILSESKAAQSVKKQIASKRDSFVKQVKTEEDKLRQEQKEIEAKRNDLSKEELVKKFQEFEKRRIAARNKIQEQKGQLDQSYGRAMNTLTKVIYEVCQAIADEKEIDLVITKQNIVVGNKSLNITNEVMSRMNSKLPNLTLD